MFYTINVIHRDIQPKVEKALRQGLVAIVYGARQVGKTTLAKQISQLYTDPLYLNCDDPTVVTNLTSRSAIELKSYIGNANMVIIDEAQRVENIGISIKLLHDTYPQLPLLVTGSSSLDLANKIAEPLTGRSVELLLYPFSVRELSQNVPEMQANARTLMVRGGYPGMWPLSGEDAEERLRNLATNYLYRDAFSPMVIYDQTILNNLLRLLAYQIGNEVNYSELSRRLGISRDTIERYIDLLEKAFIVFRRNQFRRNQRAEVGRLRKIYFVDLGVRNALVDNFQPLDIREDSGSLWENFCILERLKYLEVTDRHVRSYYWRNSNKREIDLVEEEAANVRAYEFKLGKKRPKQPVEFIRDYPGSLYCTVNPTNFNEHLFDKTNPAQAKLFP